MRFTLLHPKAHGGVLNTIQFISVNLPISLASAAAVSPVEAKGVDDWVRN